MPLHISRDVIIQTPTSCYPEPQTNPLHREMYGDDGSVPARPHRRYPRPAMDYEDEDEDEDEAGGDEDEGDYDSAASDEYEARNPYLARLDRPWQFMGEENEDDYDHREDDEEDLY